VTDVQELFQNGKYGFVCHCNVMFNPNVVLNILSLTLKPLIKKYYDY